MDRCCKIARMVNTTMPLKLGMKVLESLHSNFQGVIIISSSGVNLTPYGGGGRTLDCWRALLWYPLKLLTESETVSYIPWRIDRTGLTELSRRLRNRKNTFVTTTTIKKAIGNNQIIHLFSIFSSYLSQLRAMKNGLTFWSGEMATPFSFRDDSWTSRQIWNLGIGTVKECLQVSL